MELKTKQDRVRDKIGQSKRQNRTELETKQDKVRDKIGQSKRQNRTELETKVCRK